VWLKFEEVEDWRLGMEKVEELRQSKCQRDGSWTLFWHTMGRVSSSSQ